MRHPALNDLSRGAVPRFALLLSLLCAAMHAGAQATVGTASRRADLQAGGYFTYTPTRDYTGETLTGLGLYVTYDFLHHFGVEGSLKQLNSGNGNNVYERSYEIGPRFVEHYGIASPYVRASYGRGVFNYPRDIANVAYNLFAVGGGSDFRVAPHINVRVDADYQMWQNFPVQTLSPLVISGGVAYHF